MTEHYFGRVSGYYYLSTAVYAFIPIMKVRVFLLEFHKFILSPKKNLMIPII